MKAQIGGGGGTDAYYSTGQGFDLWDDADSVR